jgi:maltokinase
MTAPPEAVVLPEGVVSLLPQYLGRQRWFSGSTAPDAAQVAVMEAEQLAVTGAGSHRLLWAIVSVSAEPPAGGVSAEPPQDSGPPEPGEALEPSEPPEPVPPAPGPGRSRYQLLIGERPNGERAEFLNGHESSVLGSVGDRYYYDATVDSEMALAWLAVISDGSLVMERVRPVGAEQSNTSLVYDERLIAKIFRKLAEGPNPDIEVTEALSSVGFEHVAQPAAVWRKDAGDLAFVQQFLAGGTEGWKLALTSLRDLYSCRPGDPCDAGGDFAHEASRLGHVTAEMHLAMAEAFGVDRDQFRLSGWPAVLDEIEDKLRSMVGAAFSGSGAEIIDQLREITDPGPAIRVHGDYHLGKVMRTDSGWYVLDFEGEPARGLEQRLSFTSPFKDVTGMLRSFQYAAHFALLEREEHEREELEHYGDEWERHNREAYLDGYFGTPRIGELLPQGSDIRQTVSLAFELQKALYELDYERAYRPDWVAIPAAAVQRILAGSVRGLGG